MKLINIFNFSRLIKIKPLSNSIYVIKKER